MYESGNEDKIDEVIQKNNLEVKAREEEAERVRLNTIHQMEINRKNVDDETKKREYLIKLSDSIGVTQIREEVDKLNTSVSYIAEKMAEDRNSINEILGILKNPSTVTTPGEKINPMEKIEALSQLIQPLAEAYKLFKGTNENTAHPLISQEMINEKMTRNFMDVIETGEDINSFIKDALKKKVTRTVVNQALAGIGRENHGPITD